MSSYRQFYSNIAAQVKEISSDSYIPPRFVYYETIDIIADFLRKDQDSKRKLSLLQDGWSEIEEVKMEEVPVISCPDVDVRLCDRMMKSEKMLPEIFSYTFGSIIKHVASPNFAYFFNPTTPRQWNNIQKLTTKDKNKYYFFLLGGYLYIPIPKEVDIPIEQVRISAYFMEKHKVDVFNYGSNCSDCSKIDLCKSPLDYDVVCPSYLINDVKQELLNRLVKLFVQITQDEYPNLNTIDKVSQRDINNNR